MTKEPPAAGHTPLGVDLTRTGSGLSASDEATLRSLLARLRVNSIDLQG